MQQTRSVGQILAEAFAALEAGRLTDAQRLARALDGLRPAPNGLAYLQGLLALADGQGRKAAQHLQRAMRQTPAALPPILAFARAQTLQGRYAEALSAYRQLLALTPDVITGWRELAAMLMLGQAFREAGPSLRAAVRLQPDSADLRNNLGIAERALGHLAAAEKNFRLAVQLDPGSANPYGNLAGLLRHRQPATTRDAAVKLAACAVRIAPDNAAYRVELGQAQAEQGDDLAALAHFQQAVRLLPRQAEPLWLLAEANRRLGRIDDAAALYRHLLSVDPADSFGAALVLAQLGQTALPAAASQAHIGALYDQYAGSFDQDLLTHLDYRGPDIVLDGLRRLGIGGPRDILDLGCGTGLAGVAVRPLAGRLDGIDLSAKMVEQARLRGVYDALTVGDIGDFLKTKPLCYDLAIAADVLIYQGVLHPVAEAVFEALRPGGCFAFTVERSESEDVLLQSTGRFAHSADYLRQVAIRQGFVLSLLEQTTTRREQGVPVPGLLCLLTKP